MTVNFWQFLKKPNSTARPDPVQAAQVTAILKDECSIVNPRLVVAQAVLHSIPNYAEIPAFGRFYFVADVILDRGMFVIDLKVDVLATAKTYINTSYQYVLRAYSDYNGDIMDNMYPIRADVEINSESFITNPYEFDVTEDYDDQTTSGGMYSVGIVGNGTTQYYLFSASEWYYFLQYILSDAYYADYLTVLQVAMTPELKLAVDPLEFITSCQWLPIYAISSGEVADVPVTQIHVGIVDVACSAYRIINPLKQIRFSFTLRDHPQSAMRGEYLNASPYTRISLSIPPFGVLELDTTKMLNAIALDAVIEMDKRIGSATLKVYALNGSTPQDASGTELAHLYSQLGVPVQLSHTRFSGVGVGTLANALGHVATGAIEAGAVGVVTGGLQAIGDLGKAMTPVPSSFGGTGGFDSLHGNMVLQYIWSYVVDENRAQLGRPLCERVQMINLSGYCLCSSDSDVETNLTAGENDEIRSFLRNGFYLE